MEGAPATGWRGVGRVSVSLDTVMLALYLSESV